MAKQLTFDLPVRESRARGDFFVSDANALAVARLDGVGTWPNGKLVLVGPEGSGKSHLGQVWADTQGAVTLDVSKMTDLDVTGIGSAVVLEFGEVWDSAAEEAVFHLHNHMMAHGLPLLMLARTPPAQWAITLPDLKSRMTATDSVRIEGPDDALLAAVLVKQFADRQLSVSPAVISWLVTHMDRSFREARRVVAELDAEALSEGRSVTRPLAQKILGKNSD